MNLRKSFGVNVFIVAVLLLLLAACSNGNTEEGNQGEPANPAQSSNTENTSERTPDASETKAPDYGPAELVVTSSSGWTEEDFNQKIGDFIREKFPDYTIQYIQQSKELGYNDLILSSQPIDIFFESVASLAGGPINIGLTTDLTDLMRKHQVDVSGIDPSMLEVTRTMSGGDLFAFPVLNNTMMLYYNKDIFDESGEPYPQNNMSWDEIHDIAKRLTKVTQDGQPIYGLANNLYHTLRMNQLSIPYVDPETNLVTYASNPGWKSILNTFDHFNQLNENASPSYNEFTVVRNVAMFPFLFNSHLGFATSEEAQGLNWGMVTFPYLNDAPGVGAQSYPTYFGMADGTNFPDQAMEVLKFLVSDEMQMNVARTGTLPASTSTAVQEVFGADAPDQDQDLNSVFTQKAAPMAPKSRFDGTVEGILGSVDQGLKERKADINTLLREAEEKANMAIENASVK